MSSVVQDKDKDIEKKEKEKIRSKLPEFISSDQITSEMEKIVRYYGTDLSNANDLETRRILSEVSSLNSELVDMREENM
ncbi:MAG: hypothetical protein WA941_14815 [Nitrososphaeraceae archaeon]